AVQRARRWDPSSVGAIAIVLAVAVVSCNRSVSPANQATNPISRESTQASREPQVAPSTSDHDRESKEHQRAASHDLSVDEAMGGHTLDRHIGKTDEELVERLQRERDISSASTYTDRETAERVIGAALASAGSAFGKWRARRGRRPNFVL